MASSPNSNPISVYSQASYANPAANLNPERGLDFNSSQPGAIPNDLGNRSQPSSFLQPPAIMAGVTSVPNDAFEAMGGQTVVFPGTAAGPDLSATPMQFMPTVDLATVFRFDISPSWVKNRWEYVSTSPGDVGLQGLRVGLVTGTNVSDLAGSLTYFFDAKQICQRITFRGWSGDSSKLVAMLSQNYDFERSHPKLRVCLLLNEKSPNWCIVDEASTGYQCPEQRPTIGNGTGNEQSAGPGFFKHPIFVDGRSRSISDFRIAVQNSN